MVNGTAPEECSPQMKQLRKNPTQNTTLGKKVAVCVVGEKQNSVHTIFVVTTYRL